MGIKLQCESTTNSLGLSAEATLNASLQGGTICIKGDTGPKGDTGKSAYDIAKDLGKPHTESEEAWINSLKGEKGIQGEKGKDGEPGKEGPKGEKGEQGQIGQTGKNGKNGEDGFSPTVSISDGIGNHTISITDREGTKKVIVKDGRDGTPGEKGERGQPGESGKNATINGQNAITIQEGNNITISQVGNILTISSTASGGGTVSGNPITFDDIYCKNANTFHNKNGYIKTGAGGGYETNGLPEGRESWGVLSFIGENPSTGTGIQTYYVCSGNYAGEIWTRAFLDATPTEWELSNRDVLKNIQTFDSTTITLTKEKYQTVSLGSSATINLPSVSSFAEIHLFFKTSSAPPILRLPSIKWQNGKTPEIEQNKQYELIFTTLTGTEWLGGVVVYG